MIPEKTTSTLLVEEEKLLTVKEVAAFLDCSESWVYRAAADGTIPAVRIGALVRFDRHALRAWIHGEKGGKVVALPTRKR